MTIANRKALPITPRRRRAVFPSAALFDLLEKLKNLRWSDLFDWTFGERAGQVFEEPFGFGGGRCGVPLLHPLDVFLGDQAKGSALL
ncbi:MULTISPECIES: hypothetical protein [unclassified Mesorhizobium]|uniref:hypothetical protein n=1 Tax=unclassified Mesorhizobium TaxID=325217 RepID=UPI0015CB24A3|nr:MULTISPECIES: hypothetical protein [unclassified Mesorhizobium]